MIEKIQVIIIETDGVTKSKRTLEVSKSKLSQARLKEIKENVLKALGVKS